MADLQEWGFTEGDFGNEINPDNFEGEIAFSGYNYFFDCEYMEFIKRCYAMQKWGAKYLSKYHSYKEFFEWYNNLIPASQ